MYPAYVEAHKDVFEDRDVEAGAPGAKVERLIVLETLKMSMGEAVEECCEVLQDQIN